MSTLTIRISRSTNPRTPEFYRLHSAFNSRPTSKLSLYKTGDIAERDLLESINLIRSIIKPDSIRLLVDEFWGAPVVSADTLFSLRDLVGE